MDSTAIVMLPCILMASRIDWEEGNRKFYLQVAFAIMQALQVSVTVMVYLFIRISNDTRMIRVPKSSYPSPGSAPEYERISIKDYDYRELRKGLLEFLLMLAVVLGVYYKWRITIPLVSQTIMVPLKLGSNKLFLIHILGKKIARPFPLPENPLAKLFNVQPPAPPPSEPEPADEPQEQSEEAEDKTGAEDKTEAEEKTEADHKPSEKRRKRNRKGAKPGNKTEK